MTHFYTSWYIVNLYRHRKSKVVNPSAPQPPVAPWIVIFYHDVGEIFWPQPIRSLKLGHVTGQGSMSPTWVGRVSDLGKKKKRRQKCNQCSFLIIWFIFNAHAGVPQRTRTDPRPVRCETPRADTRPTLARYGRPACIVHWFACNTRVIIFGM